ncbi:DUF402 domain-containing protein [Pyrococcus furiosus DSM 3638]|uniref:DUF402 domain-containing protein n=3 Tax=Pyrococcus furiosus TaxID=2261 RepID=Q8U0G3_PYRFU|nr:DUF402 domain-containing protein [Pyrococcus furiosus]AAL81750.1 hypothetical protein PF1626 [Pyrococcus furiosus DSM 3638]AFN05014.1 hypothetical protein PFC_10475 [Pyrococcus furiosus COM1]QEK79248.1 DUF402 domain-containing protein [Pyrococcus furiosus DSM 3638]
MRKIRLVYRRFPNRVIMREDEVIEDFGDVIVAKSEFTGMLAPLRVNGVEVINNGYKMVYFAFIGRDFDVLKIYDPSGNFKGLYVDVLDYTRREGNTVEILDLFLDIFIFPEGEYYLLDEDELEMAFNYGIISREKLLKAYDTAERIIGQIKRGKFPPKIVWEYSL